jgi:malic enzyme
VFWGKAMLFKEFADVDAFPICLHHPSVFNREVGSSVVGAVADTAERSGTVRGDAGQPTKEHATVGS